MTGTFYFQQFCFGRNHLERLLEFGGGAEGIARAVDEKCRRAQVGQMLRPLLLGLARRMKRIGEQKEGCDEVVFFGAEHAGLTSAIGVAAEVKFAGLRSFRNVGERWDVPYFLYNRNCVFQASAIAGGVGRARRSEGSHLAIGEIAAEHGNSCGAKCIGQSDEKRCLRVGAGTVSEHEGIAVCELRDMQKSANGWLDGIVGEGADGGFGHELF